MVNKARLIEHIASLAKDKRIEGIYNIRDESDKEQHGKYHNKRKRIVWRFPLNIIHKLVIKNVYLKDCYLFNI